MNVNRLKTLLVLVAALLSAVSFGQVTKVKWTSHVVSGDSKAGGNVVVELDAAIDPGWHLYSINPTKASNIPTKVTVDAPAKLNGAVTEDKPVMKYDGNFSAQVEFHEKEAKIAVPVTLGPDGTANLKVLYQACNDKACLPPTTVPITVGGSKAGVGANQTAATNAGGNPPTSSDPTKGGLLPFIFFAFTCGLAALLTPCVFPMIPITVSYFAKQRDSMEPGKTSYAQPVAYCLGIISAFTGFGLIVTLIFGASGIQKFATNPIVNLFLAALFIALALNLFGIYELSLPSSLQNRFSTRGKSGIIVPILMGLTFTLTSFTCTVPFVGTILVNAASGQILYPLVGMLAFSSAFALPFFLLALFPQYLAKLPKSGSWLAVVKGFMGFLEIAAAVKFFSNADLIWGTGVLSRTRFLSVWAVVAVAAALFLFGVIRLPKIDMPKKLGPGRLIFIALSLVTAVYLGFGITGKSLGELEAFLPPGKSGWLEDYQKALDIARRTNKPVFINFTGVTCTNCRWMEKNMFPRDDVKHELSKYVLLELYTDKQSEEDARNQQLQQKLTGTVTLPIYVSVSPDGKVLAKFESSTRDPQEFVRFLASGNKT